MCRERPVHKDGYEAPNKNLFVCPAGCDRVRGAPFCIMLDPRGSRSVPCRPPLEHRKEACFQACWASTHRHPMMSEDAAAHLSADCPGFCGYGGACCKHNDDAVAADGGACLVGAKEDQTKKNVLGCTGEHCCVTRGPFCSSGIVGNVTESDQRKGIRKLCCDNECGACGYKAERGCSKRPDGCCPSAIVEKGRVCAGPNDTNCLIMVDGGLYEASVSKWQSVPSFV